ncbi:MAG TPA: nucleotidyltransferase family protein [bacterium]
MKALRKSATSKRILSYLRSDLLFVRARFGVLKIALFGSYAAGRQKRSSDIDILVQFKASAKTFDNYMDLKFYLEDKFNSPVDLVIKESLRRELKPNILAQALYV